ncbi:serine hydrolase domain-containing protein [Actinoplanes sp. NPDC049596]|uniref:serine hydrolase domain-containing protein n=1 Tax=unclassified Actinoplanes TaxID=2626549 RepID=UPI00341C0FAF
MLRRALIALIATAGLVAPAVPAAAAAVDNSVLPDKLDAIHEAGMPGAFAEVRDGQRTWKLTTGVADVTTGAPVRDGFRHRVGSISKTFLATVVLQNKIGLDTPIGRYLPRLAPADVGRRVTVRMLLNHTSGIGNYTNELIQSAEDIETLCSTSYRPEQLARIGLAAAPTPFGVYSYSNTNYVLAGLIVEEVTGHSYRGEIDRRILKPLGLRDTYFEGNDPFIRGPHMNAYVPWYEGELKDFTRCNMSWGWGAGEIVSTARDLNTFYRALLTGRLLKPAQLAAMQTTVPDGTGGGYGLGLYYVDLPCGRVWGHDGGTIGHVTVSWHSADGRRQVSYAQSMSFYQTSPTEPHPIDVAVSDFLVTALCGDQVATLSKPYVNPFRTR